MKNQSKIDANNEGEKMRQNERQERPRPPQERGLKSTMRNIPPAPLNLWRQGGTGKRWAYDLEILTNYPILSYAILLYIMYLMLSCAMYDILRHIVFGPNPVATRTRNQKTRSEKLNF